MWSLDVVSIAVLCRHSAGCYLLESARLTQQGNLVCLGILIKIDLLRHNLKALLLIEVILSILVLPVLLGVIGLASSRAETGPVGI